MNKLVAHPPLTIFVDRDGVINQDSDAYVKSLDEWHPLPGSIEALATLSTHGYQVIVITNQSGIARGLLTLKDLEAMHTKLKLLVAQQGGYIQDIFYCPHGPEDNCDCRKPLPGLFIQAQKKYNINLEHSWCVGDSYRDIEAGLAVGARVVLVKTGKGERALANHPELKDALPIFEDLSAFTAWLLKHKDE